MSLKKCVFVLLLTGLLSSALAKAQFLDSISASFHHKPKVFLNLIGYTSSIQSEVAAFSGLRVGLSFNRKVKIGIGLAGMKSRLVQPISVKTDTVPYITNGNLRFGYFETSVEYVFYRKYPWSFGVPLELGIGTVHYEYVKTKDSAYATTPKHTVIILQPEIKGQYSIFRWMGLGASLGYRFTLYSPDAMNENFNSPTFSFGLQIYLDEIYHMVFPRGICGKKEKAVEEQ